MLDQNSQKEATTLIAKHGTARMAALEWIVQFYISLFHDISDACPFYRSAELKKDCDTVSSRIRNSGLHFVTVVLPRLSIGLLDVLEGRAPDYTGLRQDECGYPLLCRDLTYEVLKDGQFATQALRALYQLSIGFKKLREFADPSLKGENWKGYRQMQEEAKNFDFAPNKVTEIASELIRSIFAEDDIFTSSLTIPGTGPGADYYKRPGPERFHAHGWINGLHEVFDPFEWHMPWALLDPQANSELIKYIYRPSPRGWITHVLDLKKARYKAVPKSFGKLRGISIMQNEVMFIQQAVRRYMTGTIRKSAYSGHLEFNDQSINATLALLGSSTRNNATVDAKSASDWVLYPVCSVLFSKCPNLWRALEAVRVPTVTWEPKSGPIQELEIASYAPMGSAVCFPVMGTIIFCISRAAILNTGRRDCLRASKEVYCYGDDLIIPRDYYHVVTEQLKLHGLKINMEKSYSESSFRESCGIHAYKGVDVTPVYVKYIPFLRNAGWSDDRLQSHITVEYDFFSRGYFRTAEFLRNHVISEVGNIPYVLRDSAIVGFLRDQKDFTDERFIRDKKKRWNPKYQCFEFSMRCFMEEAATQIVDDHDAYLRYWCLRSEDSKSIQFHVTEAAEYRTQLRWVTHSALSAALVAM